MGGARGSTHFMLSTPHKLFMVLKCSPNLFLTWIAVKVERRAILCIVLKALSPFPMSFLQVPVFIISSLTIVSVARWGVN